jgi:hypothetical protein
MSHAPTSFSDLPLDELIRYGQSLGLAMPDDTPRGEALRRVRERQALLIELDRDALIDIVMWMRLPVRRSAGKEHLAELIAQRRPTDFRGLSDRGIEALARLWNVSRGESESREALEQRLRKSQGAVAQWRRLRRMVVGSLVAKMIGREEASKEDYHFLPEDDAGSSIRREIQEDGLVGSVAKRLRGAADDYVRGKMDEIERRIDSKLDEIDKRLGEWRDREVAHRLHILKLTLVFSILVALLSLLYDYLRPH